MQADRHPRLWLSFLFALLTTHCASREGTQAPPLEPSGATDAAPQPIAPAQDIAPDATRHADGSPESPQGGPALGLSVDGEQEAALESNPEVQKWIHYFTDRDRERFQRFLDRGEPYREMVENTLAQYNLPKDLYYLAVIESGFQTHARSTAKAFGIWQFIRSTAVRYGLHVNSFVDERIDPIRSTEAAALYLSDLYNVFNSWYLAMAAYNAGEGRILGGIMRAKSRDFWALVEQRALPKETQNYVPKFLAAAMIGKDPERYGFKVGTSQTTMPKLVPVPVPGGVRLADIATQTKIPRDLLRHDNPALRRGITPPGIKPYMLLVREDYRQNFGSEGAGLERLAIRDKLIVEPTGEGDLPKVHRVRRGETLAMIANRYQLNIHNLRRLNRLPRSHLRHGTTLRLVAEADLNPASEFAHYKVRRGDSLHGIAEKFGVNVKKIKKINYLKQNRIYVGQILRLARQG